MKTNALKQLVGSILIVLTIIACTNCSKVKESQLVGNWQLVWPGEDELNVTWTFYDDGRLQRESVIDTMSIVDFGEYTFKTRLVVPYIVISDFEVLPNLPAKNGTYKIIKVNSKELVIQRIQINEDEPPFSRSEFVRI